MRKGTLILIFILFFMDSAYPQSEDEALGLYILGIKAYKYGRYEEALRYFEDSLKIYRLLKNLDGISANLNNIGLIYDSLGQYQKALSYYEESLKISREIKNPVGIAASLNNIGAIYKSLGQYQKALSYYEESLKIEREIKNQEGIAESLKNIGFLYLSLKDYRRAEKMFKDAEEEVKKTGYEWSGNPSLVALYIEEGRYSDAMNLLKDMEPRWFVSPEYQIQFYTQIGLSLKGLGKFKEAEEKFLKAVNLVEEMREKVKERGGFFAGGFYGGRIRAYRGIVSSICERLIRGERYPKDLSTALYFSESTKARSLLEAIAESSKKSERIEIEEDLRGREDTILNQLSAIDSQWESEYKKGEEAFKNLLKRKESLRNELKSLINEIREKYPKYALLYYPEPLTPDKIPLKESEILLEYSITDDATYIFRVRGGKVEKLLRIPKGKEEIEKEVRRFLEPFNRLYLPDCSSYIPILNSPGSFEEDFLKRGESLYRTLLKEALEGLSGDEDIIIVPDGILGTLPFEILVLEKGSGYKDTLYAGDRWKISYAQSATVLTLERILRRGKEKRVLFALGNPIYGSKEEGGAFRALSTRRELGKTVEGGEGCKIEFSPLPETEEEVKGIANELKVKVSPPDILLGELATETNLRRAPLEEYKYLHFAAHSALSDKIQGIKEPFLLLGRIGNKGRDDGFLTLTEVLDLKLNAEIVVLSACMTGRGDYIEGEGVVNFARAFHHAGARTVVVSLWEVASKETVEFMVLFYKYLREGKSKSEALRLTRSEIKKKYPNPFFWGSFILHGER